MKTRKKIYTAIGVTLIILNLLVDLVTLNEFRSLPGDNAYVFGYYVGAHILLFIGIALLLMAYRLQKKITRKEAQQLIDSIGKPET